MTKPRKFPAGLHRREAAILWATVYFVTTMWKSEQGHWILPDKWVARSEGRAVRLCLTNQHPVKWIAMQPRKSAPLRNGSFIQGERGYKMFLTLRRDELGRWLRQRKFAEAVLDGNFQKRHGAEKNLIVQIANCSSKGSGQFAPPETSQRNSQVSSRILICLRTSAKRLLAMGH